MDNGKTEQIRMNIEFGFCQILEKGDKEDDQQKKTDDKAKKPHIFNFAWKQPGDKKESNKKRRQNQ